MHSSIVYFSQIPVWQTTDITILVKRKDNFIVRKVYIVWSLVRSEAQCGSQAVTRNNTVQLGQPSFLDF